MKKKTIKKKMKLEIWTQKSGGGGPLITEDVFYEGESLKEIAALIDKDQNEIDYYMKTGDFKKIQCFCFQGLFIKKAGIVAIKLSEAEY